MTTADWPRDTVPSARYPVYTRLNAADVLPDPITPLGQTLLWEEQILPGWALSDVGIGAFTMAELATEATPPPAGFVYGYMYIDQSFTRVFGQRSGIGVDGVDTLFFGAHPDAPPHVARPDDESAGARQALRRFTTWALTTTEFPELQEQARIADQCRRDRPDLATTTDWGLVARARSVLALEHLMWDGHNRSTKASGVGPGVLGALVGAIDPSLVLTLIGAAGDVDSASPSYALWSLSRDVRADPALGATFDIGGNELLERLRQDHPAFAKRFDEFIADFGYRGPNEWDLGSATWETHPRLALALVDRLRLTDEDNDPTTRRDAREQESAAALERVLGVVEDPQARQQLAAAVSSARRFAAWRERSKCNAVRVIHEARMPLVELGRRLAERGVLASASQVFFAVAGELDGLIVEPSLVAASLAAREEAWRGLFGIDLPTFVDAAGPVPALTSLGRKAEAVARSFVTGQVLRGSPCAPGRVRGRARVVLSTASVEEFQPGEILVAPQTDPSWTPLFMVASGVVVDVGSMVSHAMIVSRELGVPCVAGVSGATTGIRTGALLEIDGASGQVTIVEG